MNFSSQEFWIALTVGTTIILLTKYILGYIYTDSEKNFIDRSLLAILSLSLLLYQSVLTLTIFVFVMLVTYFFLRHILNLPKYLKYLALSVLLILQFFPLLYYKYSAFISSEILGIESGYLSAIIIPVGISFYTFQMVGFVIDNHKSNCRYPSFLDYLNFASFFPQIVAGPIERKDNLLPQVQKFRLHISLKSADQAFRWIILGLFMKLTLADNLASAMPWITSHSENAYVILIGSFVFGLRIYFDFAGYSFIALGLGRLFGIDLTLNFISPYTAINIQDFWHRWHRSLSSWFRDYLYFPLGGSRTNRWALNILIVFVVSGLWHGAGWNFILWGIAHGLLLVAYSCCKPYCNRIPKLISWTFNILVIVITWLLFYQTDSDTLFSKLNTLISPNAYSIQQFLLIKSAFGQFGSLLNASVWISASIGFIVFEYYSMLKYNDSYAFFRQTFVNIVIACITLAAAPVIQNGFIYFNF